jgi:hypothetical protein
MNEPRRNTLSILVDDLLQSLRLRPQPIRTADALEEFLKQQSAFVSQKTVVEYCRIKAGVRWQKLFREADFKAALETSRWISMRAVLCDLTVIVEGYLREASRPREMALAEALGDMVARILAGYERDPAWQLSNREIVAELRRRLARAQMAAPLAPDRIARTAGAFIFDALPVHSDLRAHDREVIVNNVRFGATRFWENLIARVKDRTALVQDLLGANGAHRVR